MSTDALSTQTTMIAGNDRDDESNGMAVVALLRREFNAAIEAATANPAAARLKELWLLLEPLLEQLNDRERLVLAGEAIAQLATLCHLRAEQILLEWEEIHNDVGPAMSDDLLAGLVQQTMYLNISALTRKSRGGRKKSAEPTESIAGVVEKAKLLDFLEVEEAEQQALAVAHNEDVSAWVEAITNWSNQHGVEAISLLELWQGLRMPLIEVWLGLLLGGYRLESCGAFYDASQIQVKLNDARVT
jgi:hypothetical protein